MRSIRFAALVAAAALTGLAACNRPNLDATGNAYEAGETADAAADTGTIAPPEGPATEGGETGGAEESGATSEH